MATRAPTGFYQHGVISSQVHASLPMLQD